MLNSLLRRPDERGLAARRLRLARVKVDDAVRETHEAAEAIRKRRREEQLRFATRNVTDALKGDRR